MDLALQISNLGLVRCDPHDITNLFSLTASSGHFISVLQYQQSLVPFRVGCVTSKAPE